LSYTLRTALTLLTTLISAAQAAPTVTLTSPGAGWSYNVPASLTLKASAAVDPADPGATLTRVEFYVDGQLIGSDSTSGYNLAWNNGTPGSHTLSAKAIDSLGQETLSAPVTVTLTDSSTNQPPTVSLTAPANNAKYALPADITLSASAADVEKNGAITQVEFLADGALIGTSTTKPYSITWSNPPGGTHSLTARATDKLGAQTDSAPRTLIIQASNTPPTVSLGGITPGSYAPPVSFTLTASASGGEINTPVTQVEFLANDQVIATQTSKPYSLTWTPNTPGAYLLAARATDNQGLSTTSTTRSVTLNASNTPPNVALSAPANNSTYVLPADIQLSANASDPERNTPVTQVTFYANGTQIGTSTTKPYSITWSNPPPGAYTLTAVATDSQGAQTTSLARTVTLSDSNAPPRVSLSSPANKASFPSPANITLTANASGPEANTPVAQVEFLADGQVIATLTAKPYSTVWQNAPVGSHVLTVRATDSLGSAATSLARTITVTATNQTPTVSLTSPSPGSVGIAPASFTLTANGADSDGTVAKVDFYQGGTLIGTATTAPYSVPWSNVSPGNYSLTAVATDDQGASTTSAPVSLSVIANSAPTVSLTSPSPNQGFTAPASVTLTANAADADNNLAKVEFFNGTTLLATLLSPPYTTPWSNVPQGSYTITAIATDATGAQTTSSPASISVGPAQASIYYIYADHLNTPRLITDASNNTVWRNLPTTEPFGNSPPEEDPNQTGNSFRFNLRFPGQYADKETNTNYNFYRDNYFTDLGRYGQSDPIGLSGGINTYGYVHGSPVNFTDPLGLKEWVCQAINTGGVGYQGRSKICRYSCASSDGGKCSVDQAEPDAGGQGAQCQGVPYGTQVGLDGKLTTRSTGEPQPFNVDTAGLKGIISQLLNGSDLVNGLRRNEK